MIELMNILTQALDSAALPAAAESSQFAAYRNKLRRTTLKVAMQYEILPTALVLKGVQCIETELRGAGGFSDVFCGTYKGQPVALKRLRVFAMASASKKQHMKHVRISLLPASISLTVSVG